MGYAGQESELLELREWATQDRKANYSNYAFMPEACDWVGPRLFCVV